MPKGILEPSLLFVPFLLGWAYFVWTSYLPKGLGEIAPLLKSLFRFPLPPVLKPWWIDLLLALVLAFAALLVGGWLLRRTKLQLALGEYTVVATTSGFTALLLAASALSLVHLFKVWPLRILAVVFLLLGLIRARTEFRNLLALARNAWRSVVREPGSTIYLTLIGLFLFFGFIATVAPEVSSDALRVHLYFPLLFLERGYFYFADLYRSNSPLYPQVLYSIGLALRGPELARFLNFLFLPGLGATLFLFVRAVVGERPRVFSTGLLAVLFLVSCPVVLYHATICYPDLATAFFSFLALYAVLRLLQTNAGGWLWLTGLNAGMAVGSKYAGLYFAAILAFVILAGMLYQHGLRRAVPTVLLFGLLAAVVGGPWYLRNWYYTGDPLHPAMYKFLKKPAIDPVEAADSMLDAMNRQRFSPSARNVLTLPWLLTMNGHPLQGTIGPVFLWALPLVLLSATRSLTWMMTAAAAVAFSLLWFVGPQWLRYFLPGIPMLACLAAYGSYYSRTPVSLRRAWTALGILFALVNLPGLNRVWVSGGDHVLSGIPYDVAFGKESAVDYQRERIVGLDAIQYLNTQPFPSETRILPVPAVGENIPPFLSKYPVIDVFENGHIVCANEQGQRIGCYLLPGDVLRRNMDRHRVGLLSICRNVDSIKRLGGLRLEDPFLRTDFKLLGYLGGCFLYERWPRGPAPGMRYVNVDLLNQWATRRRVSASQASDIHVGFQHPAGQESRLSLIILPTSTLSYSVRLADQPQLSFALGMSAKAAAGAAGIDLNIFVRSKLGESEVVFTERFLPQDAAKGWMPFTVDLSAYSGQECVLTFQTTPVAPGVRDWLGISDPVIYAIETGAPVLLPEEPYEFEPASLKNLVHVQFTPGRVRSGIEVYAIEIAGMANVTVDLLYSYRGGLPETAEKFCRLDAKGRAIVPVPAGIRPGVVRVKGVRRAGEDLWLAADGTIEVIP